MANQTYIELYSELLKHREPRVFDQLLGDRLSYVNDDKSHIRYDNGERVTKLNTAICSHVMRAGRHYVSFTREGVRGDGYFGIIRPLKNWDKKELDCLNPVNRGYISPIYKRRELNDGAEMLIIVQLLPDLDSWAGVCGVTG